MICATIHTELTPDNIVLGAPVTVTAVYPKWVNPDFIVALAPHYLTDLSGNSIWNSLEIRGFVTRVLDKNTWLVQTTMSKHYRPEAKETKIVVHLALVGVQPHRYEVSVMSHSTWNSHRPR